MSIGLTVGAVLGGLVLLSLFASFLFRRVVPTNEVHIVQCSNSTTSYGKDTNNGNTYYLWPSFLPFIGVTSVALPTSVFDLDLVAYEAYDKGRLPFVVDVKAFFRVVDSNLAAQRVASIADLKEQLMAVVQGAIRTILATSDIEEIMQGRSKFGDEFTKEVSEQLAHWGVATVKNIELMDLRDTKDSKVIQNIMAKKKSLIEMESRKEVAENERKARTAEIEARREIDIQEQQAKQAVGLKTVENQRQVEIAKQEAEQAVKEQAKVTKQKEMEITRVATVRQAEIQKEASVVTATQDKEVAVVKAEAHKQTAIIEADGNLDAKKKESEGIAVEGKAKAEAAKAMQLAPVEAQITLAKEIGENQSYQQYLITIEQIKANQSVGIEQAKALQSAGIKVIANSGTPSEGLNGVMDLFSSKGGQAVASMVEGLIQTEAGKKIVEKFVK